MICDNVVEEIVNDMIGYSPPKTNDKRDKRIAQASKLESIVNDMVGYNPKDSYLKDSN